MKLLNDNAAAMRSLRKCDFVLVSAALIFAPFTQLRIGSIGISEVTMLLFVASVLLRQNQNVNITRRDQFVFTRFWLAFLLLSFFGLGYNVIVLGFASGTVNFVILDTVAYIMAGMTCFALEILIYNNKEINLLKPLHTVFYASSFLFLLLFALSRSTHTVFGFTLLQYQNFRPLATNVHHPAMSMAPLPFIGLQLLFSEKGLAKRVLTSIFVVSNIVISFHMASTKLLMGLVAGLLTFVYFFFVSKIGSRTQRLLLHMTIMILVLLVLLLFHSQVLQYALIFFETEDGGGIRQGLWESSLSKILRSPFVGYGPGPHALLSDGTFSDAHQSLLTVGLQGGIIAMVLFSALLARVIMVVSRKGMVVAALMGILIYALGGDILRRLPMWIFLICLYYYSLRMDSSDDRERP